MIKPITNFFGGRFKDLSRTLVQKIAISNTDKTLDALKAITTGKLVFAAAIVYEKVDINMIVEHIMEFFVGI